MRPVYHRVAHRIDAHLALTVIALLLERMAEHACVDTWRNIRDDLKRMQIAQLIGPNGTLWQVTEPRPGASKRLKYLQIHSPRDDLEAGLNAWSPGRPRARSQCIDPSPEFRGLYL